MRGAVAGTEVKRSSIEVMRRFSVPMATVLGAGILLGCGSKSNAPGPYVPPGTNPPNPTATGNWQITFTPTSGATLFPTLSGYLKDDESDTPPSPFTTAEMTAYASSGCFVGRNSIFLYGNINGADLPMNSSSVNGQFLSIDATLDATSSNLTGTYKVNGGCANGAAGTMTGFRVSTISGKYTGTTQGASTALNLQLSLQQNSFGNGNGYFEFSGSASVTGISCFGSGTIVPASSLVTGTSLQLTFSTSDPSGAQLVMTGTVNAAANTLTISGIQVTAGSCSGTYGTASLKL